jgi:hypothetical protein
VASSVLEVQYQVRVPSGNPGDIEEDVGRQERVIYSIEKERVESDLAQISNRAGARVVIYCVIEAVNRCREDVVEVAQSGDRVDARDIREVRVA